MNEEIVIRRLWVDELFTVDYSVSNAKKQIDCLLFYCKSNVTIKNELKRKWWCSETQKSNCKSNSMVDLLNLQIGIVVLEIYSIQFTFLRAICLNKTMNTHVTAPVTSYSVCWSASKMLHHYHPIVWFIIRVTDWPILLYYQGDVTSLAMMYSTVYLGTDQIKHQSSMSLAFVRGIHRWPVNSPDKWPVTRKMFPFDYVIMW